MKTHRIRIAKCIDNAGVDHKLVEVRPDHWLEVQFDKDIAHKAIHAHNRQEKKTGECMLGYNTRAFSIGLICDWHEADPVIAGSITV